MEEKEKLGVVHVVWERNKFRIKQTTHLKVKYAIKNRFH